MNPLRVMVVDDSAVFRRVVGNVLATFPDVEVVATAPSGSLALAKLQNQPFDLMTLDLEMPGLDGLATLAEVNKLRPKPCEVVMVSSATTRGAEATVRALELGAYDFVTKPVERNAAASEQALRAQLAPILAALKARHPMRPVAARPRPPSPSPVAPGGGLAHPAAGAAHAMAPHVHPVDIVAIGVSTGGPAALARMVPMFSASFPAPLVLVQHMPAGFTETLALSLSRKSEIAVLEAVDGATPKAGTLYIAPGGRQLRIARHDRGPVLEVTNDAPEHNCKPSVDYLFRSVAAHYGPRAVGVIMTGMGADGVAGLCAMRAAGAYVLAQDAESSTVFGMPGEAIAAGTVHEVLALDKLAYRLALLARSRASS